jgi:LacI family transcriptional regulator
MLSPRVEARDLVPRYIRIRDEIIRRIEDGELKPGAQIPSLREMCEEFEVSSITARRALLDLLNEGIVERRGGLGAFVTGARRRMRVAVILIGYSEAAWRQNSGSFGQLVGGIASAAWEREASLAVVPVNDSTKAKSTLEQLLRDQPLDGLLFRIAGEVDWSILEIPRRRRVSVVLVKRTSPDGKTPSVMPDAQRAGRLSVEYLAKAGHRRIALVATTLSTDTYRLHRQGFEQGMKRAGLSIPTEYFEDVDRGLAEDGLSAARRLLGLARPPTAIVTNSDFLAVGVYAAVSAAGLSIPGDVSVVSFDDLEFAAHLAPPLSTVRLSYYDLGHAAAASLFRTLEGKGKKAAAVVPVELVERSSVGPPPRA